MVKNPSINSGVQIPIRVILDGDQALSCEKIKSISATVFKLLGPTDKHTNRPKCTRTPIQE